MAAWLAGSILLWLLSKVGTGFNVLWNLLSGTVFTTPDVTVLPQVAAISGKSQMIVNVGFVLAIITAGIVVMTHETVQIRYGIGELAPRLVVGFIAANFATPICTNLIALGNALTQALTGENVASKDAFAQLLRVVNDAMTNTDNALLLVVIGLLIAVLTAMLLVTWLVRLGVLIVLVGIAPVALACHALPYTDGAARLWWRSMLGVLATVVLQALALHTNPGYLPGPERERRRAGHPTRPDRHPQPPHRHLPALDHRQDPRPDAPLRHPQQPEQRRRAVHPDGPGAAAVPPAAPPAAPRPGRHHRRRHPRQRRNQLRPVGRDHRDPVLAAADAPPHPRVTAPGPHHGDRRPDHHRARPVGDRPGPGHPATGRPSGRHAVRRVPAAGAGRGHPGHRHAAPPPPLAGARRHPIRHRLA
jgi:hypothetical protein